MWEVGLNNPERLPCRGRVPEPASDRRRKMRLRKTIQSPHEEEARKAPSGSPCYLELCEEVNKSGSRDSQEIQAGTSRLDLGRTYCSWLQVPSRNAQLMATFSERHISSGLPSLALWGGKEEFYTIKGTHKQPV